jgi:hypothetical protein
MSDITALLGLLALLALSGARLRQSMRRSKGLPLQPEEEPADPR